MAIARFRLLVAALKASDVHRLADAPAFRMNLATGDSLLHGPRPGGERQMYLDAEADPLRHVYDTEDADELRRILGRRYHVVVGNPPYITLKDTALNEAYRERFGSCHTTVLAGRAVHGAVLRPRRSRRAIGDRAGRLRRHDHGELVHEARVRQEADRGVHPAMGSDPRHRHVRRLHPRPRHTDGDPVRPPPDARTERQCARCSASEASRATPDDPAQGLVWTAIVDQIDQPGRQSAFVSVADMPRESFQQHPWSIGGGGAAELKERARRALPRQRSHDVI